MAPSRHARAQAERLRRFHRRCRVPGQGEIHHAVPPRDTRPLERWPAGRGDHDPAAGPVRSGAPGGRRTRHDALPQVLGGPVLDRRLRILGRRARCAVPARVFAAAQPEARHVLPGDSHHDRRPRRSRRACTLLQVRLRTAEGAGLPETDPDPRRGGGQPRLSTHGPGDCRNRRPMGFRLAQRATGVGQDSLPAAVCPASQLTHRRSASSNAPCTRSARIAAGTAPSRIRPMSSRRMPVRIGSP